MVRLIAWAFSTHYSLDSHFFMVNSNDGIKTEANIDYDMDTLGGAMGVPFTDYLISNNSLLLLNFSNRKNRN